MTLCLLYLAQGLPWGFVTYTLAAWFAGRGMSASELGTALAITTAPWTFKFLWGPVVDRFSWPRYGRRRPYIIGAQALMGITILAILALPDLMADLRVLVGLLFLHNVFSALQDVAVDALAVDLLPESERGVTNGLMYGSKYLGGALGGAGLSQVVLATDLRTAIGVQGLILFAILLLPLFLRERAGDRLFPGPPRPSPSPTGAPEGAGDPRAPAVPDAPIPHQRTTGELLALLLGAFALRSASLGALFVLFATVGAGALGVVSTILFIQRLGWTEAEYSTFAGGPALAMGLFGAIAGGWLADRLGRKTVVAGASALLGLQWIAFAALEAHWQNDALVKGFLLAEPLLTSLMAGGLFALCMDLSLPAVAATQFTAYMALSNLSTMLGQFAGGQLGDRVSYPTLFVMAGLLQIAVAFLVLPIDPLQARRVLSEAT